MTLVLALKTKSNCYMIGDRFEGLDDSTYHYCARPKLTKKSEMLIGAAGNGLLCSALIDLIDLPIPLKSADPILFLTTALIPHYLKELDFLGIKYKHEEDPKDIPDSEKTDYSVHMLFVINQGIYDVELEEGKITNLTEYSKIGAIGIGSKQGIAALQGLLDSRLSPKKLLFKAMNIVTDSNIYVKAPFDLLEI